MAARTLILAAALALCRFAYAGEATLPPGAAASTCPEDADLSGLIAHLRDMAARLPGLDGLAAADTAEALQARADERAGLCAQLEAAGRVEASLRAQVALRDELLAGCQADRLAAWTEWEAQIKRPRWRLADRLGWSIGGCVIMPLIGNAEDEVSGGVGGCLGWRP